MNQSDNQNASLSQHRIVPPSTGLRERVLETAHEAWEMEVSASDDVPWKVPVFRFAASIAVAVLLIGFVNRTGPEFATAPRATPISYPDIPGSSGILKRNSAVAAWPRSNGGDSLRRSQRELREMLNSNS